jgi:transglutaminase-like putative cysteine protease
MSAPTLPMGRYLDSEALYRRLRLGPAEGWATLIAVALLAMTIGWSLDEAGWVPRSEGSTEYLAWLAGAATLIAVAFAKLGLGHWRTLILSAILGGLALPYITGGIVSPALGLTDVAARFTATAGVIQNVYDDLVVRSQPFTSEYGHYHLLFGAMVWAAGQQAGWAAVGRRRPLDAIVVTGILVLANMGLTEHEQLNLIVIFSVAAMVLLIRTHVFEEQVTWLRRRIGDPTAVSNLYIRGGTLFIVAAVIGSLVLTGTAASAPLQGVWKDLPQKLAELGRVIERLAPGGGDPRNFGAVNFGSTATTNGKFLPTDTLAFVATLPPSETKQFKWRAGTYANYQLFGWSWGDTQATSNPERAEILAGTGDDPTRDVGRRAVRIEIAPDPLMASTVVSPQSVEWVDQSTTFRGVGARDRFTVVETGGTNPYVETALVPIYGDGGNGITENRLRSAGHDYPSDILDNYTRVPVGAVGPAAQAILDTVENQLGGRIAAEAQPYDLARALETYFHTDAFQYQTDVQSEMRATCSGISTVECFARIKRGYCEFYASAYAVLLRQAKVPTRIAYGFLPGVRTADGVETVRANGLHWWVEAYFPRYGWIEFDPTGGSRGQPQPIPSGALVTPAPSTNQTIAPDETDPPLRSSNRPTGAGGTGGGGAGPFAAIALILGIGIVLVALIAARRAPQRPMAADQAWGGLGRLAGRLGFGPRPQQTVYEYANALGDLIPAARTQVGTVARAKVEVAYGRHDLGVDRLRGVGEAYRRLRLAMIGFGVRRRLPKRRPRPKKR